jgi:xanthine dehydrogenase/oxidase
MNGVAVINACKTLKDRLDPFKAQNPTGKWEDWVSAAYFQRVNLNAMGFFDSSKVDFIFTENSGTSYDYLVFGAGCVEVEVDCQTGDVSVLSVDIVIDVGRSLNPAIDIGQV